MKLFPLLVLAAVAAIPARATPPSRQSVEKLADLTQVSRIRDDIVTQRGTMIENAVKQVLAGKPETVADRVELEACKIKIGSIVDETMSKAKIQGMFADIYAKNFTQEEVDGLIAFYSSPIGKVLAGKQLAINDQAGAAFQQAFGAAGMKLQVAMYTTFNKIKTAHTPAPAVVPAPAPVTAKPASAPVKPADAPNWGLKPQMLNSHWGQPAAQAKPVAPVPAAKTP
jgi:uncharacterized protein